MLQFIDMGRNSAAVHDIRVPADKLDLMRLEIFCTAKKNGENQQPTEWEKKSLPTTPLKDY